MQFRSTSSHAPLVSLREAVLRCLPPDKGLYVPSQVVDLRQFFLHLGEETCFSELVASVAPAFFHGELDPFSAARVAENSCDFEPELEQLDENISVLNLYNGCSGIFKDFGVTFLAAMLEEYQKDDQNTIVLSAVRGNNGANLERAFLGRKGLTSVILYPTGPIRGLNPAFSVINGGNVIPIQIRGTLDDCQRLINEVIHDRPFAERYNVTSANTINPGSLLPQAFYYFYALTRIKKRLNGDLFFSVPCGNFGNLISGLYAWKFGLPVNGFIAAMNVNNTLGDFFRNREFEGRPAISTNSAALDVSVPSNYPRLCSLYDEIPIVMRTMVFPASIDDTVTIKAMEQAWKQYGLLLDPQSAVAFAAARDFLKTNKFPSAHVVVLATGHPARESGLVGEATGQKVSLPDKLFQLKKESDPIALIEPYLDALEGAIVSFF